MLILFVADIIGAVAAVVVDTILEDSLMCLNKKSFVNSQAQGYYYCHAFWERIARREWGIVKCVDLTITRNSIILSFDQQICIWS